MAKAQIRAFVEISSPFLRHLPCLPQPPAASAAFVNCCSQAVSKSCHSVYGNPGRKKGTAAQLLIFLVHFIPFFWPRFAWKSVLPLKEAAVRMYVGRFGQKVNWIRIGATRVSCRIFSTIGLTATGPSVAGQLTSRSLLGQVTPMWKKGAMGWERKRWRQSHSCMIKCCHLLLPAQLSTYPISNPANTKSNILTSSTSTRIAHSDCALSICTGSQFPMR